MSKTLFLVLDNKQYFFSSVWEEVNMRSVYRSLNQLERFFLHKRGRFYYLTSLFLGDWKEELNEFDMIVVFDSAYSVDLGKYIKKKRSNCKLFLYYYNPIL